MSRDHKIKQKPTFTFHHLSHPPYLLLYYCFGISLCGSFDCVALRFRRRLCTLYSDQLSTQAFSRSLDLAWIVMTSPNRWRHEISRQVEWAKRECLGTRLYSDILRLTEKSFYKYREFQQSSEHFRRRELISPLINFNTTTDQNRPWFNADW